MRKWKKAVVWLLVGAVWLVGVGGGAWAKTAQYSPVPTSGIKSIDPNSAYGEYTGPGLGQGDVRIQGGSLIAKGYTGIDNMGNGRIVISGYTRTYSAVEYLSVKVFLQKWDGYDWVDIDSASASEVNSSYVDAGKESCVGPGFYRVRGEHYARDGSFTETQYSETSYIEVK